MQVFAGPQQQQPVRPQRVMEDGQQALLQLGTQVDEQVAAAEQVELGERGVAVEVVDGEDHHVAQLFADAVASAFLDEEPREPRHAHVLGDGGGVKAEAARLDGRGVDVGSEELHPQVARGGHLIEGFKQQHRHRVGFFAGGAAGGPHPHHRVGRFAGQQRRQVPGQGGEGFRIAKKPGDADEQLVEEQVAFGGVLGQVVGVGVEVGDAAGHHPPLDAPQHRVALVVREVVAGARPQQHADGDERGQRRGVGEWSAERLGRGPVVGFGRGHIAPRPLFPANALNQSRIGDGAGGGGRVAGRGGGARKVRRIRRAGRTGRTGRTGRSSRHERMRVGRRKRARIPAPG